MSFCANVEAECILNRTKMKVIFD